MGAKVWVVQGDPRDHHGQLIGVFTDKRKAELFCYMKLIKWNRDCSIFGDDAEKLPIDRFLDKYLGTAWITTPQLSEKVLDVVDDSDMDLALKLFGVPPSQDQQGYAGPSTPIVPQPMPTRKRRRKW